MQGNQCHGLVMSHIFFCMSGVRLGHIKGLPDISINDGGPGSDDG